MVISVRYIWLLRLCYGVDYGSKSYVQMTSRHRHCSELLQHTGWLFSLTLRQYCYCLLGLSTNENGVRIEIDGQYYTRSRGA